jgi:predicted amidohydrolase
MKKTRYRASASCFEPDLKQTIEIRRENLCSHIEQLLKEQSPDLLILPETAIVPDFEKHPSFSSEQVDGPTVKMISKIASDFSTNICIPIIENDNGCLYNSAVYVNRYGDTAGKYRKTVPTSAETDCGIKPGGASQPPITIDNLRIGTAICFDCNFPDLIWNYIKSGIDLLVFPAYTYAGKPIQFWALSCGVPLICSSPWESVIYNRDGSVLAAAGAETSTVKFGFHPDWIACTLDYQSRIYHLDDNQLKLREIFSSCGSKIDVRLIVKDARMMITVISEDLEIEQLERKFGLVPIQQYLRQSRSCLSPK